jgi:hypothetical protein
MSIVTLRAQIKTIVDAVKTAEGDISTTYDYQEVDIDETPAVCVIYSGAEESTGDTAKNRFISEFIVRTMVERTGDYSTQITLLLGIVDDLLEALRDKDNITLGGNAYYLLSVDVSEVLGGELDNMKVLYVDITVQPHSLKSI